MLWRQTVERRGIELKPGLIEMLDFVEQQRLTAALATSSEAEYADLTLRRSGLLDRFAVVVSGDRVTRGKPAPDIYLEAARQLAVSPADCVAFEDSEAGIRAVAAAGMMGILVPDRPPSLEARRVAFRVAPTLQEARVVLASLLGGVTAGL